MRNFWRSLFLTHRFFTGLAIIVVLMILGQYFQPIFILTQLLFALFITLFAIDFILLYQKGSQNKIQGKRQLPERFSNGDLNNVHLSFISYFGFKIKVKVIDELPVQFQKRDFLEVFHLKAYEEKSFSYEVRPVTRGEYHFGALNIIINTPLSLLSKRFIFDENAMVKSVSIIY